LIAPNLKLDTKVRIATLILALIVVLSILRFGLRASLTNAKGKLSVGTKLRAPAGYKWGQGKPTLALVLHVGCPHCENEMPFYEDLVNRKRSNRLQAELVAFFPDPKPKVDAAYSGRLAGLTRITSVDLDALMVRGTPTLFVVDGTGTVRFVWVGELDFEQTRSVMDAIGAAY
jgi:thiol-disulfide isomerase/thioredoxin